MYSGTQRIDLHGRNKYQAKIIIDSELKKAREGVYRIQLVHGQTYGTELRDMIKDEYSFHPKVLRIEAGGNGGQTVLILRELYTKK